MKDTFYYQRGYGGLEWVLVGALVALTTYFFIYPTTFHKTTGSSSEQICYINPPDTSHTITDHGENYNLIKPKAPITSVQFFAHAQEISDTQTINGKERQITKSFRGSDGAATQGAWRVADHDDEVFNLRFIDVTDEVSNPTPGISYVDIYLKDGVPIPAFIENFCGKKPKLPDIMLIPDNNEHVFPPYSIDVSKITDWHCAPKINDGATGADCNTKLGQVPTTGKYYLYAYDSPGSYLTDFIERTGIMPYGSIDLTVNNETSTYKTVYAGGWESKHIGLYGTNPDDPSQQVVYRYIKEDLLKLENERNPYFRVRANPSSTQRQDLQLEYFTPSVISHTAWWTPECKPAVYLYPTTDTLVNVKVNINNGFLTYTDPLYPLNGWNVLAKPNGDLQYLSHDLANSKGTVNYPTGIFPYLYYEGKIQDQSVNIPTTGFIKHYDQLPAFFDDILPKLGLNHKETEEFKSYWLKALPKANYYFIGIIPQDQLNTNEPLTITPKQDTMIRVRLYFEALDKPKLIEQPIIQTPSRTGFTVVDWGGMVKQDKQHPFTCLQ
jgi:hypothetical protein